MLVERKVLTATVVQATKAVGLYTSIVMVKYSKCIVLLIGVEYWGGGGGARAPKRFYNGGSAPAEILLNLIAVTILANPETIDAAKKDNIHS